MPRPNLFQVVQEPDSGAGTRGLPTHLLWHSLLDMTVMKTLRTLKNKGMEIIKPMQRLGGLRRMAVLMRIA